VIASIEEAMARLGVSGECLTPRERHALDGDGYVLLRGVIDAPACAALVAAFERRYVPSHLSDPPRGRETRHAMFNDEPAALCACLAPRLLASVHHLLRRRFFLADVQGRDPLPGGGEQRLHRDWVAPEPPAPMAIALAYLDPFGPANGATRVLPGSHLLPGGANAFQDAGPVVPGQVVVEGDAGDVLVMAGYLVHAATRNSTDIPRRNLQINYRGHELFKPSIAPPRAASDAVRYLLGEDI
jgi:hypothetical protein